MVDEKILNDFMEQFESMDKDEVRERLLGIANNRILTKNQARKIALN